MELSRLIVQKFLGLEGKGEKKKKEKWVDTLWNSEDIDMARKMYPSRRYRLVVAEVENNSVPESKSS